MQVTAINNNIKHKYYNTVPLTIEKTKPKLETVKTAEKRLNVGLYEKRASKLAFCGVQIPRDYIYGKSIIKHRNEAKRLNPQLVKDYFTALNIPYDTSVFPLEIQKIIDYCCFHTAEIYRQIHQVLPTIIMGEVSHDKFGRPTSEIIGSCYCRSNPYRPLRAVTFNLKFDWANYMETHNDGQNFSTTGHFLHPFVHEFAHSIHNHNLFTKYGSPDPDPRYIYNPGMFQQIMVPLNNEINGSTTQYITQDALKGLQHTSRYGATLLPETIAEEITKSIIDSLDVMTLRLKKNPFPIKTNNSNLDKVFYEAWEGLINDGEGLLR